MLKIKQEEISEKLEQIGVDKDIIMTLAQQWEEARLKKGVQQRIQQGMEQVIFNMLKNNRSIAEITEDRGLSEVEIIEIQKKVY